MAPTHGNFGFEACQICLLDLQPVVPGALAHHRHHVPLELGRLYRGFAVPRPLYSVGLVAVCPYCLWRAPCRIIAYNFGALPIRTYFSTADYFSARSFGWEETAERVAALNDQYSVGFIAGTHYTISAPLGFALKNTDVTDLGSAASQFRYWFEPTDHWGENALILSHSGNGLGDTLAGRFETVELVDTIEIYRQGYLVEKRYAYLGKNFKD